MMEMSPGEGQTSATTAAPSGGKIVPLCSTAIVSFCDLQHETRLRTKGATALSWPKKRKIDEEN